MFPYQSSSTSGSLVRWQVVGLMFVVSAVSYLDRNNLSIAASAVKESYGLSDVQLGLVFSAFALGYALSQPFAGWVADCFGPYKTIIVAIIWWSIFTALTPLVPPGVGHALGLLIAVRLLLGIGEAAIFPASNRLISSWIPSSERGLANGLVFAGVGIGGGVAPPLVTWIMISYGWQWAFYISAIIGLVIGVFWVLFVRDLPRDRKGISSQELAYIENGLPPSNNGRGRPVHWTRILRDRQVITLTLSYFCFGYVAYIFFSWFFVYLSTVRGLDLKVSAVYSMLPFLAMTVFSTLGGVVSDRLAKVKGERTGRCLLAAAAMVLASVFVAMATQVADARFASIILAGGAGSLYIAQSAYWTLTANIGGQSAGVVSGIMNMGAQFGGVITASTTALVAESFGWTASFLVAAAVAFVGGLIWLVVNPHHTLRDETAAN